MHEWWEEIEKGEAVIGAQKQGSTLPLAYKLLEAHEIQ
jgi:hypothetical protein